MKPHLTDEQRQAVDSHHGFVELEADGTSYVLMSSDVFRQLMGVGSEAEYRASLAAIEEGLVDVEAGRTRPMDEFFQEFDRRHGLQG